MTRIPELTDMEHETLRALVLAYGAEGIAELARCMEADERDAEQEEDRINFLANQS